MSDSEEEFASADEGEASMSPKKPEAKQDKIKKTKDKQEANTDKSSEQAKSDKTTESGKAKGEQNEGKSKKGGGVGDAKKSSSASKPQESNSSASGKGKQAGKKGKQKVGKKGGKEAADMDKPKVAESTDKDESGESQVSTHKTEQNPTSDIKSEEANVIKEETEKTVEKSTEGVTKPVDKSESENVKVTQNIGNPDESSKGADESNTKPANTEEVKTPTKSNNTTVEKVDSEAADLIISPSTQSIPRPDPDHTQEQENVLSKLAGSAQEKKQSGWGWGWGSSILNVASSSVSTFTSQVGEGFNTMIETVESTLNVPSPEDLVKQSEYGEESDNSETLEGATAASRPILEQVKSSQNDKQEDKTEISAEAENQSPKDSSNNWFSSWGVGNITKMVESTGKTLVTGSLDALETLGKKTMDALNDHDPGLKKTRGIMKEQGDKPNLSAMLRDARDHHEEQVKLEKESEEARKAHFGTLFDDFQGLAHLEALEILSNQSEKKVSSLLTAIPGDVIASLKPQLLEIKANFEIGDEEEDDVEEHDFTGLVADIYGELSIGTSSDKLTRTHVKIRDSLKEFGAKTETEEKSTPKEIHQEAIQSLAEFTSKCIEQFHKSGEMVLLVKTQNPDFVSSSKLLHSLTRVMCTEIGILSTKYTECLNSNTGGDDSTNMNQLVTSVYLEASNSGSYVQDGFQLLLPVLQQAAIEKNQEPVS